MSSFLVNPVNHVNHVNPVKPSSLSLLEKIRITSNANATLLRARTSFKIAECDARVVN